MPKRLSGRERLAQHMDDRRLHLGLRWADVAERAGVTTETLRQARLGPGGIRALTKRGIERALRWESGSVNRVLSGGEPTAVDDIVVTDERPMPTQREELRQLVERVPEVNLGRVGDILRAIVEES